MKVLLTVVMLFITTTAFATGTTTVPEQDCPDCICYCEPCPDCVCKYEEVKCPEIPDCICPEQKDCPDCNCPDPCPSPCDNDSDMSGTYTIMGVGVANGWGSPEVTLGTFTIFQRGDYGWGYQCIVAGGADRRGCQTYFLRKK